MGWADVSVAPMALLRPQQSRQSDTAAPAEPAGQTHKADGDAFQQIWRAVPRSARGLSRWRLLPRAMPGGRWRHRERGSKKSSWTRPGRLLERRASRARGAFPVEYGPAVQSAAWIV